MLKQSHRVALWLTLKSGAWPLLALAGLLAVSFAVGRAKATAQEALTVTASFSSQASVTPDEALTFTLNRPLRSGEGRLAIMLGECDLTSLFTIGEKTLQYGPHALPLPLGETEVAVCLIAPNDEWKELARFPLRVAAKTAAPAEAQPSNAAKPPNTEPPATQTEQSAAPVTPAAPATNAEAAKTATSQAEAARRRFGFDKFEITPSLNLGFKSQFAESHFPDANRPARPTFADTTLQGAWKSEMVRGPFNFQSQYDLVGSSFRQEALRFGDLGVRAPKIDLSNYLMQVQQGERKFLIGHNSFGAQRHLLNNFSSRGLTLTFPVTTRTDFALTAMNSTSLVGFDNFFGLNNRRHQLFGGTFGVEFLPQKRGALRFEGGLMDAWFLPRVNVNQGVVNDAERNQGLSARLLAKAHADRFRFDAGFTRSRFVNPEDPLLNQGARIAPARQTIRNARYADVSYDLLKDFSFSSAESAPSTSDPAPVPTVGRKLNLTLNFRHERVDPLFRSIGAATQADKEQNQAEVVGTLGEVAFTFSHTRFNDNLAGIPSILKTLTRRNAFNVNLPLTTLLGKDPAQPNVFLPRIGYTFDHVRAFAAFVPVGGGFDDPSTIPNQANVNQALTAEWQIQKFSLTYQLNHSLQDNRQRGREQADLRNLINSFVVGWNALTQLELNFQLNAESANNREQNRTDRTLRFGLGAIWQVTSRQTVNATFANTGVGDLARTSRSRNTEYDLQWAWNFTRETPKRFQKVQTIFFIRYANRFARVRDQVLGVNNLTKLQTLNAGLNFIFF